MPAAPVTRCHALAEVYCLGLAGSRFITNHALALGYIANHPEARLRDVASSLDVTERTAYAVVAELTEAGYLVKERDGRRNRYHVQRELALGHPISHRTVGELVELVIDLREVVEELERPEDEAAAESGAKKSPL